MITQTSDFQGDIFLPQTGADVSRVANDNNLLKNAISQYEVEILVRGLGRKMTNTLYSQLNNGRVASTTATIYKELVEGKEYTYEGEDYFWRGLVDTTGAYRKCMMAYYIYYHFVRNSDVLMTTMGAKKGNSQNTDRVSSFPKLVTAWRTLHEWYMGECETHVNAYYHRGHYVEDYFNDQNEDVSLYQFLLHNKEFYPEWRFRSIENKNVFDI